MSTLILIVMFPGFHASQATLRTQRACVKKVFEETPITLRCRVSKKIWSGAEILITIQVDVVDAHFAALNTIHYLLKVWVFDLQSVADQ